MEIRARGERSDFTLPIISASFSRNVRWAETMVFRKGELLVNVGAGVFRESGFEINGFPCAKIKEV
jgi:hypothetical protein